jgi:hypothetical protein
MEMGDTYDFGSLEAYLPATKTCGGRFVYIRRPAPKASEDGRP